MHVQEKNVQVNSLWPSDTIWWHRSGLTLVQVMPCCLTAPSHYLNQCWLVIKEVLWHSFQGDVCLNTHNLNSKIVLEIYTFEIMATSPRGQCVKIDSMHAWNMSYLQRCTTGLRWWCHLWSIHLHSACMGGHCALWSEPGERKSSLTH